MKKILLFTLLFLLSTIPIISALAERTNFWSAEELLTEVKNAEEDLVITLDGDVEFETGQCLVNQNEVMIQINGNGFSIKNLQLDNGRYELNNLSLYGGITLQPGKGSVSLNIASDCATSKSIYGLHIPSSAAGEIQVTNAGALWGSVYGINAVCKNSSFTLVNHGTIGGAYGMFLTDEGTSKGQTMYVQNEGKVCGMLFDGANLSAQDEDTTITIEGTGQLFGSTGAAVGGAGSISIDQRIEAHYNGTIEEKDMWPSYYYIYKHNVPTNDKQILTDLLLGTQYVQLTDIFIKQHNYKLSATSIAEIYSMINALDFDKTNGYAIVDRGSLFAESILQGSIPADSKPSSDWLSPELTVRGSFVAERGPINTIELPRKHKLIFESEQIANSEIVHSINFFFQFQKNDLSQLDELIQESVQNVQAGELLVNARVTAYNNLANIYNLEGEKGSLVFSCTLSDQSNWSESVFIPPSERSDPYDIVRRINDLPQNSRLVFDRDVLGPSSTNTYNINLKEAGIVLDGQGHAFKNFSQYLHLASKSELIFENFSSISNIELAAFDPANTVFKNCLVEGIVHIGKKAAKISLEGTTFTPDNFVITAENKQAITLSISKDSSFVSNWICLSAESGGTFVIESEGDITSYQELNLRPNGGKIALSSTGSIFTPAVRIWAGDGGEVTFSGNTDSLYVEADEETESVDLNIAGKIKYIRINLNAKNGKKSDINLANLNGHPTIHIIDESLNEWPTEENIIDYLKQTFSSVLLPSGYATIEIQSNGSVVRLSAHTE